MCIAVCRACAHNSTAIEALEGTEQPCTGALRLDLMRPTDWHLVFGSLLMYTATTTAADAAASQDSMIITGDACDCLSTIHDVYRPYTRTVIPIAAAWLTLNDRLQLLKESIMESHHRATGSQLPQCHHICYPTQVNAPRLNPIQ